jgi:4-hydroxyproline epimerase
VFRLESIIGSRFEASYQRDDQGRCVASITGRAFVTGAADLLLDPRDPFRVGIGS